MKKSICKYTHDIVVFDVDGVLVDTSRSYFAAVVQAVQWAWTEVLHGEIDCEGFTERHFALTKTHPAFNDDYDIAWSIVCRAAASKNPSLSKSLPSPEEWRALLEGCTKMDVPSWVRQTFGEGVPRQLIRGVCEELYFGVPSTGEENNALLSPRKGLWENERPMISCSWRSLPVPAGIYTGRTAKELHLALRGLGWEDFPNSMIITSDSGITKPSPRGLKILCETAGANNPLFLGDTESDRQTVQAYGQGAFAAIGDFLPDAELAFPGPEEALMHFALLPSSKK